MNAKFDMAQSTDLVENTELKLHAGLQNIQMKNFHFKLIFQHFLFKPFSHTYYFLNWSIQTNRSHILSAVLIAKHWRQISVELEKNVKIK